MQPFLRFPQWSPGPRPFGADQRKRGSLAVAWIGVKRTVTLVGRRLVLVPNRVNVRLWQHRALPVSPNRRRMW
jgi:hypothetical protein